MLVDPSTWALSPDASALLARRRRGDEQRIVAEVTESTVELISPACESDTALAPTLVALRARAVELAAGRGLAVASSGTHPFSVPEPESITRLPRYEAIAHQYGTIPAEAMTYGLHIHVGMPSERVAIGVFNELRELLPLFLALSANSPLWRGRDTGLQSMRSRLLNLYPRNGVPPALVSWSAFAALVRQLERAGAVPDYTYLWWRLRPHPRLGTLELRVCDAQPDERDTTALAALVQATCAWFAEHPREAIEPLQTELVEENLWAATRSGMDAVFVDFRSDDERSARAEAFDLLERVEPRMRRLGTHDFVDDIERLITCTGAQYQLYALRFGKTPAEIVELLTHRFVGAP